jgi:predicted hydrocarbon binding protein
MPVQELSRNRRKAVSRNSPTATDETGERGGQEMANAQVENIEKFVESISMNVKQETTIHLQARLLDYLRERLVDGFVAEDASGVSAYYSGQYAFIRQMIDDIIQTGLGNI